MYRTYNNKNTLNRKYSRLLQGGVSELRGDKVGWWERADFGVGDVDEQIYTITNLTVHRPDTVAFNYYGTTELEWVILQYNNIVDINEEFVVGRVLKIPSRQYVQTTVINKPALN